MAVPQFFTANCLVLYNRNARNLGKPAWVSRAVTSQRKIRDYSQSIDRRAIGTRESRAGIIFRVGTPRERGRWGIYHAPVFSLWRFLSRM